MFYIISYDISDDGRRNRMAKTLLDFGTRVQYSVFECIMDKQLLDKLTSRVMKIISQEDSVRIYTLCSRCEGVIQVLGHGEAIKDKEVYII